MFCSKCGKENMEGAKFCKNCGKEVSKKVLGAQNRNHCSYCLWSIHVDKDIAGDRKSSCMGLMRPMSLMFKKVKPDKYGKEKVGEIMLVHQCQKCQKISLNRIAGDDDPKKILELADKENKKEVEKQLFGKKEKKEQKIHNTKP